MSNRLRAGWFLVAFFLAPSALAQDRFGSAGTFAIGAERLFGFTHASTKTSDPDGDASNTDTWTTFSLLGSRPANTWSFGASRVGADYFVINGLSLGANLGYFTSSSSSEADNGMTTQEEDGPSLHGFLFAPRVGYAFMFQDKVGLWPRGGFTYLSAGASDAEDTVEVSVTATALTLEALLVIAPVERLIAFTVGPTLDLGLGGSSETQRDSPVAPDTENDVKQTEIGVYAGMVAFF